MVPSYKAYIEPDLETAHLRIFNTFNPFSGFMNATYILKSDKTVTKQAIKQCLQVWTISRPAPPPTLLFPIWHLALVTQLPRQVLGKCGAE